MKRHATWLLIPLLAFTASRLTGGQGPPDFSRTWTFSTDLSPQVDRSAAPQTTLVITQTPTEMRVEGRSFLQVLPARVYRLDGAEGAHTGPDGTTTARAAWNGSTLVMTARRTFAGPQGDFVVDTVEAYRLDDGVMRIEKTETTTGGKRHSIAHYESSEVALARAASGGRPAVVRGILGRRWRREVATTAAAIQVQVGRRVVGPFGAPDLLGAEAGVQDDPACVASPCVWGRTTHTRGSCDEEVLMRARHVISGETGAG